MELTYPCCDVFNEHVFHDYFYGRLWQRWYYLRYDEEIGMLNRFELIYCPCCHKELPTDLNEEDEDGKG